MPSGPLAVTKMVGEGEDPQGAGVVLFVTDQLAMIKSSVEKRLVDSGSLEPTPATEPAAADVSKKRSRTESSQEFRLGDGSRVKLTRSTPERFIEGGYAQCHYVQISPEVHATCYELMLLDGPSDERSPIGYIALTVMAWGGGREAFPLGETGGAPERNFMHASVDRLVILPGHRSKGAKEILLKVSDGFHQDGYPVRIKTGKPEVHGVLGRCPLLLYEGHCGNTSASVAMAVVPYDPEFSKGKEAYHTLTAVEGRRGSKEGWAYWYIGSPVIHPASGKAFRFSGASSGPGMFVQA